MWNLQHQTIHISDVSGLSGGNERKFSGLVVVFQVRIQHATIEAGQRLQERLSATQSLMLYSKEWVQQGENLLCHVEQQWECWMVFQQQLSAGVTTEPPRYDVLWDPNYTI
jgi:hypothetical protein